MFVSDNKLSSLKKYFIDKVRKTPYDVLEAKSIFELTAMHLLEIDKLKLSIEPDQRLSEGDLLAFNNVIKSLRTGKPIQQILGNTEFYNRVFEVSENVLIPRPETEELVRWIVDEEAKHDKLSILDVGTGSGCIAISVDLELPSSVVTAFDISSEALAIANKNKIALESKVDFILKDILNEEVAAMSYDIIVSNPPYVLDSEKEKMADRVLKFEPEIALFVEENDPLIFYKRIGEMALSSLKPGGRIYFEINQYLGSETKRMLEDLGYKDVELRQDLFNNDRMIRANL